MIEVYLSRLLLRAEYLRERLAREGAKRWAELDLAATEWAAEEIANKYPGALAEAQAIVDEQNRRRARYEAR